MDGRGGCCIANYAGDGGGAYVDMSKMDRIMMRFRPIAPKPASPGVSKAAEGGAPDKGYVKTGRGRRRSSNGTRKCCRKRKSSSPEEGGEKVSGEGRVHDKTVVTLPLLPETPDLTAGAAHGQELPAWLRFDGCSKSEKRSVVEECYTYPALRDRRVVVWSSVTVECVTDMWVEEAGLGRTDKEKRRRLEEDTCPGFISDGWNRVCWTNRAFRKMARKTASFLGYVEEDDDVVVTIAMREKVPVTCQAYTCRVRVQSTWKAVENPSGGLVSSSSSVTLPCDVWRLSGGGFAWRLDMEAALSLGR